MDETRENREAAERLIPGTMKIVAEAMTPSQHTDAAWQLGHELMQPIPPGWYRTPHELTDGTWHVVAVNNKKYYDNPWPLRMKYQAEATEASLLNAHRLCREQAWQKHRKNTGGTNA